MREKSVFIFSFGKSKNVLPVTLVLIVVGVRSYYWKMYPDIVFGTVFWRAFQSYSCQPSWRLNHCVHYMTSFSIRCPGKNKHTAQRLHCKPIERGSFILYLHNMNESVTVKTSMRADMINQRPVYRQVRFHLQFARGIFGSYRRSLGLIYVVNMMYRIYKCSR